MTSVWVGVCFDFCRSAECSAEYVVYVRKTNLDDSLSLNPNRCHHPASLVNPISTKGPVDYAHHITTAPLPDFWTFLWPCTKTRGIELLESRHAVDIAVDISIEMALGPKQKVVAVAVNPSFIWTWDTSNIGLEG